MQISGEIETTKLTRWLLIPLGVWPSVAANSTTTELRLAVGLQVLCHSLLAFVIVPSVFHVVMREQDINVKIALFGPVGFIITNTLKYYAIIYHRSGIKRCIKYIEADWRRIQCQQHRDIMMKNVASAKKLTILCAVFMYTGGMLYHTLMPFLLSSPIVAAKNSSNRPIVYPGYDVAFNPYTTPTYEIIFFSHCATAMIAYTIVTVSCNLAASFVTHACGQIQIMIARLTCLINEEQIEDSGQLQRKMDDIITSHARILRFTVNIEKILREICLVEVVASTLIICLLEYYCMTTWSESETIGICTYFILLMSLSFNIFLFCYIGELLKQQFFLKVGDVSVNKTKYRFDDWHYRDFGENFSRPFPYCAQAGDSTYMTDWYRLPPNTGMALILIIAMAQIPRKITAGGLIDLSLNSFVSVIKTSLVYLNLLRTVDAS